MKGVVFNTFEEFVEREYGPTVLARTRETMGNPRFLVTDTYPDEQLLLYLQKTSEHIATPARALLTGYGRYFVTSPTVQKTYKHFYNKPNAKEFLQHLEFVCSTFTEMMAGNGRTAFEYTDPGPNQLVITYKSQTQMCEFIKALIEGVAAFYREAVQITEVTCQRRGHLHCDFHVEFLPETPPPQE